MSDRDQNVVRYMLSLTGRRASAATACFCLLLLASSAVGHGTNASARIHHKVAITLDTSSISLTFSTEMNRPAAFQEVVKMDLNGDGQFTSDEKAKYFGELEGLLTAGLEMSINGCEIAMPRKGEMELEMPFRKTVRFEVPHDLDPEEEVTVEFHNDNYLDYFGDIEVILDPGTETDIVYDSRWQATDSPAADARTLSWRQRDIVFRYKRGTGISVPPEDFQTTIAEEQEDEHLTSKTTFPTALVLFTLALLCIIIVASVFSQHRYRKASLVVCCVLICLVGWYASGGWTSSPQVVKLSDLQAEQLFQQLHSKIYQAFEATGESDIYDTLAKGLEGPFLDEVYNEVTDATSADGGEASRFDIRRVKPLETVVLPRDNAGQEQFSVRFRWRVYGVVTHHGHTHARVNQYEAEYHVQHNGQAWRITESQSSENKRVTLEET